MGIRFFFIPGSYQALLVALSCLQHSTHSCLCQAEIQYACILVSRRLPDARAHILFPSVLAFIASIFYSITVERARAEKQQQENEAMQLGMELKFLRSQISPHFLFNVLTNLVSWQERGPDQLESSLLMLSGLMRYMLYDAAKKISVQAERWNTWKVI